MISKVNVKRDLSTNTRKPYLVLTGDILLIKRIRPNDTEELLVRVHYLQDDKGFCLAVLGRSTIFKLEEENLYTGEVYTTSGDNTIEILGVCDVDIIIKNIKCYME